jgi:hypothetical protein
MPRNGSAEGELPGMGKLLCLGDVETHARSTAPIHRPHAAVQIAAITQSTPVNRKPFLNASEARQLSTPQATRRMTTTRSLVEYLD